MAQAVSWLCAEQTAFWQAGDRANHSRPRYDGPRLHGLVRTIEEHNAAWRWWFADAGVEPHPIRYEDLSADPAGQTRRVLGSLGLEVPEGYRFDDVPHRQQADELNARWIERYRAEYGSD